MEGEHENEVKGNAQMSGFVDRIVHEIEKGIMRLAGGDPFLALAGMFSVAMVVVLLVLKLLFMEVPSE